MKNAALLKDGPVLTLIVKLSVPAVVIMLVMVLYNLADIFFIGQTGDPYQVAAITLAAPVYAVVQAVGTLLGTGGMIGISTALGKNDYRKTKSISFFVFLLSLISGTALAAAAIIFPERTAAILGAGEKTGPFTVSYLSVLAIGFPFMIGTSVLSNIIRADGSAGISMIGNALGTGLNILLDPLLIITFSMGIRGAALATVIGNLASFIYYLFQLGKRQEYLSVYPRDFIRSRANTLNIILLGVPIAAGTILMSFASAFRNNILAGYSDLVIAGSGVAGRIAMLTGMIIMGITMGMQPAISYNFGACNYIRLRKILRAVLLTTVITGAVITFIVFILRGPVIRFFIDEREVIAYGRRFIIGALISGPIIGLYQLSNSFLQSTGKVSYAVVVSLLRQGIILVPVMLLMNSLWNLTGIIFSMAVSDIISIVIALILGFRWYNTAISDKETSIY